MNARSVSNKTFILKDFFPTQNLDFLFIIETWLNNGDSAPFSELFPPGCAYFKTPRSSGRGGGLAIVFSDFYHCKPLPSFLTVSFEVCMFEIGQDSPTLCAVIYHPPKYNKDFISDFSNFLAESTMIKSF